MNYITLTIPEWMFWCFIISITGSIIGSSLSLYLEYLKWKTKRKQS